MRGFTTPNSKSSATPKKSVSVVQSLERILNVAQRPASRCVAWAAAGWTDLLSILQIESRYLFRNRLAVADGSRLPVC